MARNATAYDEDFYAWTIEQARLLRAGELTAIDAANIAEEMEDRGRGNRRELLNRLAVLLAHLLKWRPQPGMRSSGWSATIIEQRLQIADILTESPSLRPLAPAILAQAYRIGRAKAIGETGLADRTFPPDCPFSLDDALSETFLPES